MTNGVQPIFCGLGVYPHFFFFFFFVFGQFTKRIDFRELQRGTTS